MGEELKFEALLEPSLVGIGGWLAWFCLGQVVTVPYLLAAVLRQHSSFYLLWNLLTLTVVVLVLVLLLRKSPLLFGALYTEFALRLAAALDNAWIHWRFVHGHHYSLLGVQPYVSLVASTFFTALWLMYFKRSKRVLATFGRNL